MVFNLFFFKKNTKLVKEIKKMDYEDLDGIRDFILEIMNMYNEKTYSEIYLIDDLGFINNTSRKDGKTPYLTNIISLYGRFLDSNNNINYHSFPKLGEEKILGPSIEEFLFLITFLNKNIKELTFSIYKNDELKELGYYVNKI